MLAAAVRGAGGYRDANSSPDEIGRAFLEAALRLALADHELVVEEIMALRALAAALGMPAAQIVGWHVVSDPV